MFRLVRLELIFSNEVNLITCNFDRMFYIDKHLSRFTLAHVRLVPFLSIFAKASITFRGIQMVTYITLAKFTDQGIRTIKDTTKRADMAKEMAGKFGVKMTNILWTNGEYDLITISEAADDESMAAFGLLLSSAGNVRLQSLKAFNREEMNQILSKIP